MTSKDINKAVAVLFKAGFTLKEIEYLFKDTMVPDAAKCLFEFVTRPLKEQVKK